MNGWILELRLEASNEISWVESLSYQNRDCFYDFATVKSGVDKKSVTFYKKAYIHHKFDGTQERAHRSLELRNYLR